MARNSVRYPTELRERAVRMVHEGVREGVYSSEWAAISSTRDRQSSGFIDRCRDRFGMRADLSGVAGALMYIRTRAGWVYAAFIIDACSKYIVGWQTATTLRAGLAVDALEMALATRRRRNPEGLVHHSDRGSQHPVRAVHHPPRRKPDRRLGRKPRRQACDNAPAESTIGLYKTELINQRGPWRDLDHTTFATLEYIDWYTSMRVEWGVWQCRWGWLRTTLFPPFWVVALAVSASPSVAGSVLSLDRSVTCIAPLGCCFDAWMRFAEPSAAPATPDIWRKLEP